MEAELIRTRATGESETGETIPLGETVTIGRSPGNNLVLQDDQVSRNHALIRREGRGYLIVDLGSANGTFLNDKPVTTATPLHSQDIIRLGRSMFVFHYVGAQNTAAGQAPKKTTERSFSQVNLAILVSDIRNYTVLSAALPADGLSAILVDWFRRVGECIGAHNGTIEKFRGDSVMAYWISKPGGGDNTHILDALRTAQDMVAASREYDIRLSRQYPGYAFHIGCAVHCGDAVLGNVGADSRRDFTTLGDCVNVTFRIESLCSTLARSVLVSADVKQLSEPEFAFDSLGPHALKGKTERMDIYALRTTDA